MKKLLFFILFCFSIFQAKATHNRAGEITYRWVSGLTYEVTITTYTRESVQADRCVLDLKWGDSTTSTLERINGPLGTCTGNARMGQSIGNDVKKNIYKGVHTYSSAGSYILSFEDPNRNAGINNIPQSVSVPFYVQSLLIVAPGTGGNSSPILTNPPVDDGCLNRRFEHNPGAYDPDGDSLAYALVPCRTAGGAIIPTIYDPNYVKDPVKIDSVTGDLIWDLPKIVGQFNFAIEIREFRKSGTGRWEQIGYVTRDLQVNINNCGNNPPVIDPVGPFCVEAGQNLNFKVTANDVDGDPITLTAFGAPFRVPNPADSFYVHGNNNPVSRNFNWNTACNHVRQQPFYVTFEARDEPSARQPGETPLVDDYTTNITVVAPAPRNPGAIGVNGKIQLHWDVSICPQAIGYKIYRREDSYGFVHSDCETGVPAYTGYKFLDSTTSINANSYVDSINLKTGVRYCYMVVACFPDKVESYASEEFCTALPLSQPLMTNVNVLNTNETTGKIEVKWIYPPIIDSSNFPPPYSFKLFRADGIGGSNFSEIQNLSGPVDTQYVDSLLDTKNMGHTYKVELYSGATNPTLVAPSDPASSIYLKISGFDQSNILRINTNTPWRNDAYIIYRETTPGSTVFDSIDMSATPTYIDTGLVNGNTYCYKVLGIGAYTASDSLPHPLLNYSEEACGTPIDTTRPCPPSLLANYICNQKTDSSSVGDRITRLVLNWTYPNDSGCTKDVISYKIYFKPAQQETFPDFPLATVSGVTTYTVEKTDQPIVGCYAITAVDDAGNDPGGQANESRFSNIICVESCPEIEFPNVFTPNGDGTNDFFLPVSYNDIGSLQIQIFNRWGGLVYSNDNTQDFLTKGWNGRDMNSNQYCSDGVYYYVCTFSPINYKSSQPKEITGFVHLFGDK